MEELVNVIFYEKAAAETYGAGVTGILRDEAPAVVIFGFDEDDIWMMSVGSYVCGCLEDGLYQPYE